MYDIFYYQRCDNDVEETPTAGTRFSVLEDTTFFSTFWKNKL